METFSVHFVFFARVVIGLAFQDIFRGSPSIKIPRVIWNRTTAKVVTLEVFYAIKITNYQDNNEIGVDLSDVAQRLFSSYMEQIFEKEIFPARFIPAGAVFSTDLADHTTLADRFFLDKFRQIY